MNSDQKCKFHRYCPARSDCNNIAHVILSCYKLQSVYSSFTDKIWKLHLKYMFEEILEKAPSDCLCLLCISRLQVFITKTSINSAKCETTARAHDAFCPLTQAWRVNCPVPLTVLLHCQLQAWRLHCTIRAQTGLVITNRVRGFRYSFDSRKNQNWKQQNYI